MSNIKNAINSMLLSGVSDEYMKPLKKDKDEAIKLLCSIQDEVDKSIEKVRHDSGLAIYLPTLGTTQNIINEIKRKLI